MQDYIIHLAGSDAMINNKANGGYICCFRHGHKGTVLLCEDNGDDNGDVSFVILTAPIPAPPSSCPCHPVASALSDQHQWYFFFYDCLSISTFISCCSVMIYQQLTNKVYLCQAHPHTFQNRILHYYSSYFISFIFKQYCKTQQYNEHRS